MLDVTTMHFYAIHALLPQLCKSYALLTAKLKMGMACTFKHAQ